MNKPPMILDGTKAPGISFVEAVRDALAAAGLPRTSTMNGGEIAGLLPSNQFGSTGFSVHFRPEHPGTLRCHFVVSGKPAGIRYREYNDAEEGGEEDIELHEPLDPESIHPRIQGALASLGLAVSEIRCTGHQSHWDDDIDYEAIVSNVHGERESPAPRRGAGRIF